MSLIKKAKSVVKAVKKAFTSDIGEQARKQYTTGTKNGGNSRVVESVKNWATGADRTEEQREIASQFKPNNNPLGLSLPQSGVATQLSIKQNAYRNIAASLERDKKSNIRFSRPSTKLSDTKRSVLIGSKYMTDSNDSEIGAMARMRADIDQKGMTQLLPYTINNDLHNKYIDFGMYWKDDVLTRKRVDEIKEKDLTISQEEYDDLQVKSEEYEDYYEEWCRNIKVWDPETNHYIEVPTLKAGAPLPPWAPQTSAARRAWDYYVNYMDATTVAQEKAMDVAKKERDKALARPYKNAFLDEDTPGVANSLLDAFIADLGDGKAPDKHTNEHLAQYFKDYIKGPLKSGAYGTFLFNRVYSALDIMDVVDRGSRAIWAAKPQLGGLDSSGGAWFEGQRAYYVDLDGYSYEELHKAQDAFLKHGGREVLGVKHDELVSKYKSDQGTGKTVAEAEKELDEYFKSQGFTVTWQEIRDAIEDQYYGKSVADEVSDFKIRAFDNLKKTYTIAGMDYNADTGSFIGDMTLEMISSPGFLVGGVSKMMKSAGTRAIASEAFLHSAASVFGDDAASLLKSPALNKSIKRMARAEDGANIIFRREDALKYDVDIFVDTLMNHADDSLKDSVKIQKLKDNMLAELMERRRALNSGIIESTPQFRNRYDDKVLETAYKLDHAIDAIDTLLLKTSFPEPFVIRDAARLANKALDYTGFRKFYVQRNLKRSEAVQAVFKHSNGVVEATRNLAEAKTASRLTHKDVAEGVRLIRNQFDEAAQGIERVSKQMRHGKVSIEDATTVVEGYFRTLSNSDYKTFEEMRKWIDTLDPVYRAEYQDALGSLKRQYDEFFELTERLKHRCNQAFLNELDKAMAIKPHPKTGDISAVFNKYAAVVNYTQLTNELSKRALTADAVRRFIFSAQDALRSGEALSRTDVITSIYNVTTNIPNSSIIERTVEASVLKNAINQTLHLKATIQAIRQSRNLKFKWAVIDVYRLLKRKKDISYAQIYDAIDNALSNLSYYIVQAKGADREQAIKTYVDVMSVQDYFREIDNVATNDVETITQYHLDKVTALKSLLENDGIQSMLSYCDGFIASVEKHLKNVDVADLPTELYNLDTQVMFIKKQRDLIKAYEILDTQLRSIPGITEQKVYAVESALIDKPHILEDITRRPDAVWDYVNEVVYNNFGGSKLNMDVLNEHMRSLLTGKPSDLFKDAPFIEELQGAGKKGLRNWFEKILNSTSADPQAYCDKQLLAAVLFGGPETVRNYNKLAEIGEAPIFIHVSSTGFNSSVDTITAIGYREWKPVLDPDNISLKDLRKMFADKPKTFKVRMTDKQINSIPHATLRAIFDSDETLDVLRARYKKIFGAGKHKSVKEHEVLESFFKELSEKNNSYRFVVHDLESVNSANGYNMRMLVDRASVYSEDMTVPYTAQFATRQSRTASAQSINTLDMLRRQVEDNAFTNEEFFEVEKVIRSYARRAQDIGYTRAGLFDFDELEKNITRARQFISDTLMGSADAAEIPKPIRSYEAKMRWLKNHPSPKKSALNSIYTEVSALSYDDEAVESAIQQVGAISQTAKEYMSVVYGFTDKRLGAVRFSDEAYYKHINKSSITALNNISARLGIDVQFDELTDALGLKSTLYDVDTAAEYYNTPSRIVLNPYMQNEIVDTFMHELRHSWSYLDNYGSAFKQRVEHTINSIYSTSDRSLIAKNVQQVRKDTNTTFKAIKNLKSIHGGFTIAPNPKVDALEYYIYYISHRYDDFRRYFVGSSTFSDDWLEEFVAPLYQAFFNNEQALNKVKQAMTSRGLKNTAEGLEIFAFLDDFSTLIRNATHLREWDGLQYYNARLARTSRRLPYDAVKALLSDDDLINDFIDSLIHTLSKKEDLRKRYIEALSKSDPVRATRLGNAPNIVNAKDKVKVRNIRSYFDLEDDLYIGSTQPNTIIHVSMPTLQKMDGVATKISSIRDADITSYAEEMLNPYSKKLDEFLHAVRAEAAITMGPGSTNYDYIKYIRIPDNVVEKFLLARAIYDDCIKFAMYDNPFYRTDFQVHIVEACLNHGLIDDIGEIFDGSLNLQIFKSGGFESAYSRRVHHVVGDMDNELAISRAYSNAYYDIKSHIKQREHASIRLRLNGIKTAEHTKIGQAYTGLLNVVDELSQRIMRNDSIIIDLGEDITKEGARNTVTVDQRAIVKSLSKRFHVLLNQYRLDRLRNAKGTLDVDSLVTELLWNGHNHISFQTFKYTDKETEELFDLAKKLPSYVKSNVDGTGKIYFWLEDCGVYRDPTHGVEKRYLVFPDGTYGKRYARPEFDSLHNKTLLIDELTNADIYTDVDATSLKLLFEQYPEYQRILDAWSSVDILSNGTSRGTSGRVLSKRELEHYYNTLPAFMNNMVSPKNLQDTGIQMIFDPGFIIEGETDYFLDLLDTMHYQNNVFNNGTATLAYMFGNGAPTKFGTLMDGVPNEDIMHFFAYDSDFVVATVTPNTDYIHGVAVRQLRMDTERAIDFARQTDNVVILPYDVYSLVAQDINIVRNPESIKAYLNKALLVIKAFQLCNIGSWVRNWYDATKKAAMDMGESPSNVWLLLQYQGKAMRDMAAYRKILKQYGNGLDQASWEIIKKTTGTDMLYEDYLMLSNLFHSDNLLLSDKYFKKNAEQLISGQEGGIRGLSETDIKRAFTDTFGDEALDLDQKRFVEIYQHLGAAPSSEESDAFEKMLRQIDVHLKTTRPMYTPDKVTNIIFHPFSVSENVVRYAQAQYLRDFGLTDNQISKRIHLTQFASRRYSSSANYIEYVIPYANYMYDNMMYWMRLIEENPRYFKYFTDIYGEVVSDHIEDMLDKDQAYDMDKDYMLKTGGIPIGNNGLYFKLNPSVLDFLTNFYGGVPNFMDKLNPLLNITTRHTMSEFGLGARYMFRELDLDLTPDSYAYEINSIIPILNQIYNTKKQYNRAGDYFGDAAGIPTKTIFAMFSSLFGIQTTYGDSNKGTFEQWQSDLEAQGKWFDANLGRVVDLSEKNEYGANNPKWSWEDRCMYMLVRYGKLWDGNQGKFVKSWEYTTGGFNEHFDFDKDPTAWDRLCDLYYKEKGMVWDANIKRFVPESELSPGDLNDESISWPRRCELMYEKFGLVFDQNRYKFVKPEDMLEGGLNDDVHGKTKAALRLALFGQVWDEASGQYIKVQEPEVVLLDNLYEDDSDRYYKLIGIPHLMALQSNVHLNSEGLLVTEDGKYVLTRNTDYNSKIFSKYVYRTVGRSFNGWKNHSFNKTRKKTKKYSGRVVVPNYDDERYQTGHGWNEEEGYFREAYVYSMSYTGPQPGRQTHYLITPPKIYPYGGGYNKFSFQSRY